MPISELKNVYDIDLSYNKEYNNIVIDYFAEKKETAQTTKNVSVKEKTGIFSDTIEKVKKGEEVIYISGVANLAKVRTKNGNIGYIKKKYLTNLKTEREKLNTEEKSKENIKYEKNITNEKLEKYEDRKKIIEKIIVELVKKNEKGVKITYTNDKNADDYKKFKIEANAMLKECGINVLFD